MLKALQQSCAEATALVERRELRALSGSERLGLWWHMRICKACQAYAAQSRMIDDLLKRREASTLDTSKLQARILSTLGH